MTGRPSPSSGCRSSAGSGAGRNWLAREALQAPALLVPFGNESNESNEKAARRSDTRSGMVDGMETDLAELRRARTQARLTGADLAARLGAPWDQPRVSRAERCQP